MVIAYCLLLIAYSLFTIHYSPHESNGKRYQAFLLADSLFRFPWVGMAYLHFCGWNLQWLVDSGRKIANC